MHNNPYVDCPYNKAHQVPKLRLQYHLVKCRKQHPLSEMKTCPFNATHIMPEPELLWHFRYCADRSLIEGQKYCAQNANHGELGNPAFHHSIPTEDWESSEPEGPSPVNNAELSGSNIGVGRGRASLLFADYIGVGRGRASLILSQMKK